MARAMGQIFKSLYLAPSFQPSLMRLEKAAVPARLARCATEGPRLKRRASVYVPAFQGLFLAASAARCRGAAVSEMGWEEGLWNIEP
jgi:hypothetical protein